MKQGRPWHPFKDRLIERVQQFQLSQNFGWTPKQIRELEYEDRIEYLYLMNGMSKAKPKKN